MTSQWMLGLLLTVCSAMACAETTSEAALPVDFGLQRAHIDRIRQQKSAELDSEDFACTSRFAVADCQKKVGLRRRQMLDELKAQEASLNAIERKQKRADQLLRTEQKTLDSAQRQQEARAAALENIAIDRQKIVDDKRRTHQEQAQPVGANPRGAKTNAAADAATVQKNRADFLEKQQALEKRRQERDQRLKDHGPLAAPLPVPH